jgi:hypothetical protein
LRSIRIATEIRRWRIVALIHVVPDSELRVLLHDLHHAFMTIFLFLLLAGDALLAAGGLALLETLDFASRKRKERWSAYVLRKI